MTLLQLFGNILAATLPPLGMGMSFNIPWRFLPWCSALGAVGYGIRGILMNYIGFSQPAATLLACIVIGSCALVLAKRSHTNTNLFAVASVLPMFPGVYAYKAMFTLIDMQRYGYSQELFGLFINSFLWALFILVSITLGLLLPSLVARRSRRLFRK